MLSGFCGSGSSACSSSDIRPVTLGWRGLGAARSTSGRCEAGGGGGLLRGCADGCCCCRSSLGPLSLSPVSSCEGSFLAGSAALAGSADCGRRRRRCWCRSGEHARRRLVAACSAANIMAASVAVISIAWMKGRELLRCLCTRGRRGGERSALELVSGMLWGLGSRGSGHHRQNSDVLISCAEEGA